MDLQLIRRWLKLCETSHGPQCARSPFNETIQPVLNLRVIDVLSKCIITAPQNCRYIALSYVWGSTNVFKCAREALGALQRPGALDLRTIPATIADAMRVAIGSGERYLWVDSLCIIQDDPVDQEKQLSSPTRSSPFLQPAATMRALACLAFALALASSPRRLCEWEALASSHSLRTSIHSGTIMVYGKHAHGLCKRSCSAGGRSPFFQSKSTGYAQRHIGSKKLIASPS